MGTRILCSITFFRKSHRLWDNFEKFRATRGAIHDVTIWRIRVACWISKATRTDAHAHVYAPGYPHARMHAHAWTHRPICNTYCFSTTKALQRTFSLLSCVSSCDFLASRHVQNMWFLMWLTLLWTCVLIACKLRGFQFHRSFNEPTFSALKN